MEPPATGPVKLEPAPWSGGAGGGGCGGGGGGASAGGEAGAGGGAAGTTAPFAPPATAPSAPTGATSIMGCDIMFPAGKRPFPAQLALMSGMIRSLSKGQHALLESPTGPWWERRGWW